MKYIALVLASAFLAMAARAGAQSVIPDNPDSLFDQPAEEQPSAPAGPGAAAAAPEAPAAAAAPAASGASTAAPAVPAPGTARGVEVGGYFYSDYTGFLKWTRAYPDLARPAAGASGLFVPDLETDLYFDARPFDTVRVFTKLKAAYPFDGVSVFEAYADLTYNDRIYLRAGQQVVNWGVGYFFSPADIISLTPIDPLQPGRERQGPLALRLNVPFADVDNLYLYVIANQAFISGGASQLGDLALAPKVEVVLGAWEIGVGAYYQKDQRPKAMMTATGSILGQIGLFAEGVLSRGRDRVIVRETSSAPGTFTTSTDTRTPTFSGTIGVRYLQADWHVSVIAQYYYNGQGSRDAAGASAANAAYALQLQGSPPSGPRLSQADVFQPGRNYLAGNASWTDIRGSKVDLALFSEANLSDGSGVVSPSVSVTPFRSFTATFAPFISYGPDNSEFVTQFGRLSLSLKLTIGTVSF